MNLLWLTDHPWGPSVRSTADFMDTYWDTTTFFAQVTYWSVTLGILFQDDKFTMSSLYLFSFASVMGRFISWSMTVFSKVLEVCDVQRLKIFGNSSPSSVQIQSEQIVRRLSSPLIQMNRHLEDVSRTNSVWMISMNRWCASVRISKSISHRGLGEEYTSVSQRQILANATSGWCLPVHKRRLYSLLDWTTKVSSVNKSHNNYEDPVRCLKYGCDFNLVDHETTSTSDLAWWSHTRQSWCVVVPES